MKGNLARCFAMAALTLPMFFSPALAGKKDESGSFDVAYARRDVQPITEGHILLLSESTGTNKSPNGPLDGFTVSVRETADLDKGNGTHNGYAIFQRDGDLQVIRVSGKVTTTMKDGQPMTTMAGTWQVIAAAGSFHGHKGEGTYSGYFTAEDKYRVEWKGWRNRPEPKAARN